MRSATSFWVQPRSSRASRSHRLGVACAAFLTMVAWCFLCVHAVHDPPAGEESLPPTLRLQRREQCALFSSLARLRLKSHMKGYPTAVYHASDMEAIHTCYSFSQEREVSYT